MIYIRPHPPRQHLILRHDRLHPISSLRVGARIATNTAGRDRHGAGARAGAAQQHGRHLCLCRAQRREEGLRRGVRGGDGGHHHDAAALRRRQQQQQQQRERRQGEQEAGAGGVAAGELGAQQGVRRRQAREGAEGGRGHRAEGRPVPARLLRRAPRHARPHVPGHRRRPGSLRRRYKRRRRWERRLLWSRRPRGHVRGRGRRLDARRGRAVGGFRKVREASQDFALRASSEHHMTARF